MGGLTRPTLHTERLRLEPITDGHTDDLVALCADPEVMRFITGRALTRDEVVEEWMPRWTREWPRGLGYWAAFAGSGFVGRLALRPEGADAAELGWRLAKSAWGNGYATEGAAALLELARRRGLVRVWAETMVANVASRRVMERLGMTYERTYVGEWDQPLPGWEQGEVVYAVDATTWRAASSG